VLGRNGSRISSDGHGDAGAGRLRGYPPHQARRRAGRPSSSALTASVREGDRDRDWRPAATIFAQAFHRQIWCACSPATWEYGFFSAASPGKRICHLSGSGASNPSPQGTLDLSGLAAELDLHPAAGLRSPRWGQNHDLAKRSAARGRPWPRRSGGGWEFNYHGPS